ncbi:hypothetical protein Tco_0624215 [Tanacetum coccineum]|uniref:Uncharacterized protein n=1 Tax=Tanacetum coccineum TaxID=301880 RepID=A0ABQ4WDB9_9ASTR
MEGSTQGYPLVSVEVLRYDTKGEKAKSRIMPTKMELTLEQTQQGGSYEVSFDESNTHVLERFYTSAGNPVKEILIKLNLPDHKLILMDLKVTPTKHGINCDNHQRRGIVSRNNYNRVDAKTTHPTVLRNMSPKAVLLKTDLTPLNTVRTVNTAHPKTAVHSAKSKTHFSKQAQSTAKRTFYKKIRLTNRYFHQKVNTVRPRVVNTASPYTAPVSTVRVKGVNAIKSSAYWVSRPTKPNGASLAFKIYNYIDNQKHLGMSKEVGTPRYLSLVVPLKKVGDEAVHKELGDRMERAATTTSSLEAEQDSGSGPRCQDTILGDVNAQTRFEITSKQSNDPPLLRGYTLGSGEDSMKLLELMEFCTQLLLELMLLSIPFLLLVYFTAAKLMLGSVNAVRHMLMLPVQVPAAEGVFINTSIKAFLEKPVESDGFADIIDFLKASSIHYALTVNPIIYTSCIEQFWATAKVQTVNGVRQLQALVDKKRVIVTESSIRKDLHLDDAEDMSAHKKIFVNPFHTKKVFPNIKRVGKDFSGRITPLFATMMVQASKEKKQSSKKTQRQKAEVSQDETEHEESVPTPSNDPQPSGEDSMQLTNLMALCTKLQTQVLDLEKAKDAQAKEIAALKKRIQRLERKKMSRPTGLKRLKKVGMSRRVESSKDQESLGAPEDASKQGRSIADLDKDDDMPVEAKVDEKDEQSTKLDDSTTSEAVTTASVEDSAAPTTTTSVEDNQIALDEQIERDIQAKLDAELIEEQKLEKKQEEEANIALIEEELTDEEKGKLFMELMEKRRKHFPTLGAQEKRNRPPTKAQKRTQMSTYLKHMGGYIYKQLKGKIFDEIQKLFDKEMKRINNFVAMGFEQQQESSKKQRIEEDKESDEDDEDELKRYLVIKKDEDIAIDAIPLSTKLPVIIDYKLLKEGMLVHYELIRSDGSSKRYSSMIRMLQGIDREDLEVLWRIVKTKYSDIRHEDEFERVLWGDIKVMFEPEKRSDVWRILQGYRMTIWKLIDSSGFHFIQKMNIKFRGGLLGLKRLYGFLEVTTAQVHNGNYAKCAAGERITTA